MFSFLPSIGMHCERIPLLVTRLDHYPIVLGIPWLRRYDPTVRFSANSIAFNSSFCTEHCLSPTALRYTTVQGLPEDASLVPDPTVITTPNDIPLLRPSPPLRPLTKSDII